MSAGTARKARITCWMTFPSFKGRSALRGRRVDPSLTCTNIPVLMSGVLPGARSSCEHHGEIGTDTIEPMSARRETR